MYRQEYGLLWNLCARPETSQYGLPSLAEERKFAILLPILLSLCMENLQGMSKMTSRTWTIP